MIALLVSLAGLLFAAAGVARHIWLQRSQLKHKPPGGPGPRLEPAEETDVESEP
jgi:hypothetical protein